jgi:hypothetical protein
MDILFMVLLTLAFMIPPPQAQVTSEVAFCNFELPRDIKIAHSTFDIVYSFEVNEDGQPVKITRVRDEHVGQATVAACLSEWRFHGIKKAVHMSATFQWQHGEGWTEISITGPDFSQKIKVNGERCPYLRMQSESRQ